MGPRRTALARITVAALLLGSLIAVLPTPAAASFQSTSDAAIYPLAICRDGIRFLFAADFYPAGSGDPGGEEAPFRVQSVQAAAPAPPIVDGRAIPPAGTLVLDVTVQVPYAPQEIDFATFYQPPVFPKYPPRVMPSGWYPQPTGVQVAEYTGEYTLAWSRKLKAGPHAVVLSFDRFDPARRSVELLADVDNCKLFRHQQRQ
jgi:hypothetical protein